MDKPANKTERIFKALANRRRLDILRLLKDGNILSVGEIAAKIGLSFTATSKHLNILFNADILEKDQKSLQIFYRIAANPEKIIGQILNFL
ncbi:MAG: metalloregulator ArsR/SmtB family transcription factor [Candidatus Paceibacterota bacterium]